MLRFRFEIDYFNTIDYTTMLFFLSFFISVIDKTLHIIRRRRSDRAQLIIFFKYNASVSNKTIIMFI